MKTKIFRFFKIISFCMVVILMVHCISDLFKPKWLENRWQSSKTNNSFYELEKNSTDVLFLGSSVIAAALDPFQLYEEYGISSYNLGVMQQPMIGTFFWMKEALKTQSPKLIVVEIKTAGRVSDKDEADSRKSYEYMRWGKNKLQYALEYTNTNEQADIFEYLFPLSLYHTRWSELSRDDYNFVLGEDKSYTRGFATLTTRYENKETYKEYNGIREDDKKQKDYNETNTKYLRRIIDLAKENNIELLFVKTPDSAWNTYKHNYVVKITEKYKASFIDFNTKDKMKELDINFGRDGADSNHLNMDGAIKFTSYIGKYISEHYDFTEDSLGKKKKADMYNREMTNYKKVYEDAFAVMEK